MRPLAYPSMKKVISSRLSSAPSRLRWMTSTARKRRLLLLQALDLGPEVAALLDRHHRRRRRSGGHRDVGQHLVHEGARVVLLRLAPGGDLPVAVVVAVEAGPAG